MGRLQADISGVGWVRVGETKADYVTARTEEMWWKIVTLELQ
jgi:hypothetical protein